MEKINIAELLKDCPKGMELDCVLWDNVTFHSVDYSNYSFPIRVSVNGFINFLTKEGYYHNNTRISPKCVIFPKGKTTWEGFVPPCEFKNGDIVYTTLNSIVIIEGKCKSEPYYTTHCGITDNYDFYLNDLVTPIRLATEEEKEKLFQMIKDNGYHWNGKTKILERLIKPKFKVGEMIKSIKSDVRGTIDRITDSTVYISSEGGDFNFSLTHQDDWELVHNKFDINTLVPFEDKVLVRDEETDKWFPATWGFYNDSFYTVEGGNGFIMCIPYKGNEHLLGKTDDCDNFFKTWEE